MNDITFAELDADLLPERQTMFLNFTTVLASNSASAVQALTALSLNNASATQVILANS